MPVINSLLSPDCILIHPDAKDKASLIKLLVESLASAGKIDDTGLVYKDVLSREDLCSTGLGWGCAVPHAHSRAVSTTVIAAALLEKGLDFNAQDGNPVNLVFLIVGPENHAGLHLKLLSKLARLLYDQEFREGLMTAGAAEDFLDRIRKREG